ncbi:MAG: NAD(P)(+) transhydrogenase (Re/Si-specific) subunit beta [Dethiobacteria bacterium]|jgi:NAD(P) transhydrogenase subunit beta
MQQSIYIAVSIVLSGLVLLGIKWMSSPESAVRGNRLSALSMFIAVILVLWDQGIIGLPFLWAAIILGGLIGYFLALRSTMLQMPQMVALLNGLGGGASAMVALIEVVERHASMGPFTQGSSQLALIVGGLTLSGSIIAALKLDRRIAQKPVVLKGHSLLTNGIIALMVTLAVITFFKTPVVVISLAVVLFALLYGVLFAIRVGGADMPITISLLNSFSGLAGAICGFTVGEPLLVAVGAIVGASGLILTQIMSRAMNRSLVHIFSGSIASYAASPTAEETEVSSVNEEHKEKVSYEHVLGRAKKVIIAPGYGMALAQAQVKVKELLEFLEKREIEVKFAIHPVAGRMPGHMNVLLAEVDVPYEKLCEMDQINPEFSEADLAIVIGACDVVNPAANTVEGTPIYGMPILDVDKAKHVFIYNLDLKPGYSGVENPLYKMPHVRLYLGNAKETLAILLEELSEALN